MKKSEERDKLVSLNSEFDEFSLEKLEERLETDPLMVGGFVNLEMTEDVTFDTQVNGCELCICNHLEIDT